MDTLKIATSLLDVLKNQNFESFQMPPKETPQIFIRDLQIVNLPPTSRFFVRLAAISGTVAAIMCTYGIEVLYTSLPMEPQEIVTNNQFSPSYQSLRTNQAFKQNFEIANRHHFIHSLALLAVPFCKWPFLTGSVMTAGIVLFCGSCYYYAFTGNSTAIKTAPYGGYLLILAWLMTAL